MSCQLSRPHPPRPYRCPPWDGGPLAWRTVLLWIEQGLGDAIQFVRFAAVLADRGGRVVVECPAPLAEVFATAPGVAAVLAEGEPLPPADCHVSMMSVPALTGLTAETIPFADRPYLSADPARGIRWREWFGRWPGRKVGLVWQGNPRHKWDRFRSRPLSKLVELAAGPGVTLFGLQRGHGSEQLAKWKGPSEVVAIPEELAAGERWTFADTAAVMACLDEVVAVDTSAAHLAGALGVPTRTWLGTMTDWRWGTEGERTAWYPEVQFIHGT